MNNLLIIFKQFRSLVKIGFYITKFILLMLFFHKESDVGAATKSSTGKVFGF